MKIVMCFDFDCDVTRLFEYFADVNAVPKLLGAKSERSRDGDVELNGVNAIRSVKAAGGLVRLEECIRTYEEHSLIEYEITQAFGIRSHWGRMVFSSQGAGSRLNYDISLETGFKPGDWLITSVLKKQIESGMRKLEKELV